MPAVCDVRNCNGIRATNGTSRKDRTTVSNASSEDDQMSIAYPFFNKRTEYRCSLYSAAEECAPKSLSVDAKD